MIEQAVDLAEFIIKWEFQWVRGRGGWEGMPLTR
jgi:hypothetical protein